MGGWQAVARYLLGFACAVVFAMNASAAQKLLHSERSMYRDVLVYEDGSVRCMCFTRNCRIGRQTCMDTRAPQRFVMRYTQMMMSSLYLNPAPRNVLIVGLGGGTLPRAVQRAVPSAHIDVVEIDPAVVSVAEQYFAFKRSSNVRVVEMDGRVFVKRAVREQRKYDIVMLDAFDHEYIPEHLLTREFIQETASLLSTGGVLAANTFSSSKLYAHESTTYAAVFPQFYNLKQDNRVILATNGPLPTLEMIAQNAARFGSLFTAFGIDTEHQLSLFSTRRDWDPNARVLTDQYSPANLLNRSE